MISEALVWTDAARRARDEYFRGRLSPERLEGADPDDLRADLMAHLTEDLLERRATPVTRDIFLLALSRMGETMPEPMGRTGNSEWKPEPGVSLTGPIFDPPRQRTGWVRFTLLWLPLVVYLFEILTRGCAGMLFDPMPDLVHHLMVLLVPVSSMIFLKSRKPEGTVWTKRLSPWLIGAAGAVVGFYALCFLVIIPMALFGLVFFGVGLLALSPPLAVIGAVQARRRLLGEAGSNRRPLRLGFWIMAGVILLVEVPVIITHIGISRAAEAGPEGSAMSSAVKLTRRFGSERALLRACYSLGKSSAFRPDRAADPASWIVGLLELPGLTGAARTTEPGVARELYYRVTGTPFNEAGLPRSNRPFIRSMFNQSPWLSGDEDRGGTQVAGRIDGLSLAEGRMDWHCEQASGLTWGEWTLTFDNKTSVPEEARCRIALPPGGFVSRVTLWVNGQPEEAAYSTVSKVRAAYESVAVVERRDPVLVTQPDAGSILVQAFPVPAQGQLKTRITFTVPAGVDSRVWLPSLVERNFELRDNAAHPIWVQADHGTLTLPAGVQPHAATEGGAPTVTGSWPPSLFTGNGTFFTWTHQPAPVVYAADPLAAPESRLVVRTAGSPTTVNPAAIAWVIDTSAPMASRKQAILAAVTALSIPGQTAIFLPGDAPPELQILTDPAAVKLECAGGRDNTPALGAAVDWMRSHPGACLIWLHGPQPITAASRSALDQLLERSVAPFTLADVPLVQGENNLSTVFAALPRITVLPVRHEADLALSIRNAFQQRGGTFSTLPEGSTPPIGAVKTSDTLARWFARQEATRLGLKNPAAASAMATSHQIVSLWSGAVVLERTEDYKKHGLTQSTASVSQQIPVIPEPSGVLLLLLSTIPFLTRRHRGTGLPK